MGFQIRLTPGGQTFTAEKDEILLDAALRQGIQMPHGCRDGACGACRGKVLQGAFDPGRQSFALSETDRAAGFALLCQAKAQGDLLIESREARQEREPVLKTLPVRVERVTRLSPEVMRLELRLPGEEVLEYRPGQYIDILLKDGRRRAFSLATAHQTGGLLELHVRHVPGGVFTGHVFSSLRERDILRIRGPYGQFGMSRERTRPALLVAGGTGFAPLKAIVEQALQEGLQQALWLYWGGRRREDIYLHDLAEQWARDNPLLTFVPVLSNAEDDPGWHGRRGLVHRAVMDDHPDMSGYEAYVCGPPPLVAAARRDFSEICHLPTTAYHADPFELSSDAPSAPSSSSG